MLWRPYAQMKTAPPPLEIIDAEGVFLRTKEKALIDSTSSWWCNIHGYKHPELTQAIVDQARRFSHVMLGGLVHEPALRLADKLADMLPGDLEAVFFADAASSAIGIALDMARQYAVNRGEPSRTKVLALERCHHGVAFTAMATGDGSKDIFTLGSEGASDRVRFIPADLTALEAVFRAEGERFHSFIVEPLLQCAGGMRMHGIDFLRRARALCDEFGVLLIYDEVATGFGRTGHRFVSDLVQPDIVVLGKALTGGYVSHAATVASRRVFDAFYGDDPALAFMQGPTFMGSPLACAAALKSIEIFERDDYMAKIRRIERIVRRETEDFADPRVKDVRVMGNCVCFETTSAQTLDGFGRFAYDRGVFSRPFGTTLYAMPPHMIGEDELVRVVRTMREWFETRLPA